MPQQSKKRKGDCKGNSILLSKFSSMICFRRECRRCVLLFVIPSFHTLWQSRNRSAHPTFRHSRRASTSASHEILNAFLGCDALVAAIVAGAIETTIWRGLTDDFRTLGARGSGYFSHSVLKTRRAPFFFCLVLALV